MEPFISKRIMSKRIVVVLHRPLDEPAGRNEKIASRLEMLREHGWETTVRVIQADEGILLARGIRMLVQAFVVACQIVSMQQRHDPLVVWTMNRPSYLHLPGLLSKLLNKNVTWVAEFRDALNEEPFFSRKPLPTKMMNFLLEKPMVHLADKIVTIKGATSSCDFYKKRYPGLRDKFEELPYIGSDFSSIVDIEPKDFDKYTITYAGRLYEGWIEPDSFLKGFAAFVRKRALSPEDIQVKFYVKGWTERHDSLAVALDIRDYIDVAGFVSKEEIFSIMKGSDVLLFIHGSNKSRGDMIHTKFYDYVASQTTILFLGNRSFEISHLIKTYNLGVIADEKDPDSVQEALSAAYDLRDSFDKGKNVDQVFDRMIHDECFIDIVESL